MGGFLVDNILLDIGYVLSIITLTKNQRNLFMSRIMNKIKENKHLRENGQYIINRTKLITPTEYLATRIKINDLPRHMINKDEFRNTYPHIVEETIKELITDIYNDKTQLLKPYDKETPRNKLLHWGALFGTIVDFISTTLPENKTYKFINDDKYDTIPKRYRSAIQNHNGMHTVVKTEDSDTYVQSLFTEAMNNVTSYDRFDTTELDSTLQQIETIRKLLPTIYKKDIIDREITNIQQADESITVKQVLTYGAKPSTESKAKQQCITDKEVIAFNKIFDICIALSKRFYYVAGKSNTHDIMAEYKREEDNKNLVLKAQRHLRTLSQVVVSAKKNFASLDKQYVDETEQKYQETRKRILSKVYDQIHPNTL